MLFKLIKLFQILFSFFYGNEIKNGPFKGIKISKNHFGSSYLPKILGSYESEISDLIKDLITKKNISYFMDIGCAGGYYLEIALALNSKIKVIGIDSNKEAIDDISIDLKNNVLINKYAEEEDLYIMNQEVSCTGLILIDIEGGEENLLIKANQDKLKYTYVIIEFHKYLNLSMEFYKHFSSTHNIIEIPYNVPKFDLFDLFCFIARHELREKNTSYIYLEPKLIINE